LDPSIDQMTGRMGKWKEDEDIKLKDVVCTNAWWQELGRICSTGSVSKEKTVS
jgi:hypothetical protein